jgi:hypothetical protein
MPAEKLGQPPPIVQAMLLADHIHIDPSTGKRYILGTYNRIMAAKFPHSVPKLCLLLALTNGHGSTVLRLRVVDMDEERGPLLESAHPANMPNPNEIYYFPVTLSVVFPAPGAYRIQLFADNDLLRELRLQIARSQEQPRSPNET